MGDHSVFDITGYIVQFCLSWHNRFYRVCYLWTQGTRLWLKTQAGCGARGTMLCRTGHTAQDQRTQSTGFQPSTERSSTALSAINCAESTPISVAKRCCKYVCCSQGGLLLIDGVNQGGCTGFDHAKAERLDQHKAPPLPCDDMAYSNSNPNSLVWWLQKFQVNFRTGCNRLCSTQSYSM